MRWTLALVAGALLVALLPFVALNAQPQTTPAVDIPEALQNGGGSTTNAPNPPPGLNLLQFDDGSIDNGSGCQPPSPNGQVLMHFGGGAPTTTLVPFQLRGLYWQMYPGFAGNPSAVNVNVWYPLTASNGPTNLSTPFFQVAATTNTMVGFKSALFSGPTISAASGDLLAGIGVSAATAWFIAWESNAPTNGRRFGACGNPSAFYLPAGGNLPEDAHLRLLVDGNIPVELEAFTIE